MNLYYANGFCAKIKNQKTSDLLIRMVLDRYYGLPHSVEISIGPQGKPFLPVETGLHFSVTHTADRWLCCVSEEITGIDAELGSRSVPQPQKLAEHFFSEQEQGFIEEAADSPGITAEHNGDLIPITGDLCEQMNASQRLLYLWTQKEAVLKRNGDGLTKLRSCCVMPPDESAPVCSFLYRDLIVSVCSVKPIPLAGLSLTEIS